jgi:hypothetical protein
VPFEALGTQSELTFEVGTVFVPFSRGVTEAQKTRLSKASQQEPHATWPPCSVHNPRTAGGLVPVCGKEG